MGQLPLAKATGTEGYPQPFPAKSSSKTIFAGHPEKQSTCKNGNTATVPCKFTSKLL
jgi:hypothetical protein